MMPVSEKLSEKLSGKLTEKRRIRTAQLSVDVRVAVNRLSRRVRGEMADDALTDGQFSVMAFLDREGPKTPRALANHEHVQPPSINRTINALVEAGYVSRNPHPDDKRQVLIALTVPGRGIVKETRRRRDDWMCRQLAALSPEDRKILDAAAVIMQEVAAK